MFYRLSYNGEGLPQYGPTLNWVCRKLAYLFYFKPIYVRPGRSTSGLFQMPVLWHVYVVRRFSKYRYLILCCNYCTTIIDLYWNLISRPIWQLVQILSSVSSSFAVYLQLKQFHWVSKDSSLSMSHVNDCSFQIEQIWVAITEFYTRYICPDCRRGYVRQAAITQMPCWAFILIVLQNSPLWLFYIGMK